MHGRTVRKEEKGTEVTKTRRCVRTIGGTAAQKYWFYKKKELNDKLNKISNTRIQVIAGYWQRSYTDHSFTNSSQIHCNTVACTYWPTLFLYEIPQAYVYSYVTFYISAILFFTALLKEEKKNPGMNTLSIECLLTTVYTIKLSLKKVIMIIYISHYRSKTSFILRTGGFYHFIKDDFFLLNNIKKLHNRHFLSKSMWNLLSKEKY